ncbi:ATP-dependent helicase HrpB [Paenarthrobacter sp. NPDC089675]|uniref:ATP-dependent helicase HrpB n=1 Tax=Paenarthrobacter sp. NPDC089675 TaxID=3364376 RepID=UPI003806F9FE
MGKGLVFGASLDALAAALARSDDAGMAVVQAPPGTGKTTLVPPLVANLVSGRGEPGPRVIVTQPRRVAARSAARRLAALDAQASPDAKSRAGASKGARVGYTVRGESTAGPATLVEFVTPGILMRRLLKDPGLDGVQAVVLDEIHERGLETDLLIGMLAEVRELRGDLILVAMSATVDAPRFATLLGRTAEDGAPAPVVDCPSALHPLTVDWVPSPAPRLDGRGVSPGFLDHVARTAATAHAEALDGDPLVDALVFLPGAREVNEVAARLRSLARHGTEVLELHGQVAPKQQDRAVSGRPAGGTPRIIVSTALAESSLTVPGVRLVIDAGLSREPRRDAARGMSGLVTVSCSKASAEQRAGRAARQGPGRVVRCYDEQAFAAAPAHQTPEIAVADLTGAALLLACWGSPRGEGLALPDQPPAAAIDDAVEVLRELGAISADGFATDLGKSLALVPVDPRLARALLDGSAAVGRKAAAEAVALVSGDQRAPGADLVKLLSSLHGTDPAAKRFAEEVRRLETLTLREASTNVHLVPPQKPGRAEVPGFIVALAFPDRIARQVPGEGSTYLLTSGTRAGLPAGSSLAGHQWLAVAEVSRAQGRDAAGTGAVIRSAAPLSEELARATAPGLLGEVVRARFDDGRVIARLERSLGAIVLSSTPVRPTPEVGRRAVAEALAKSGLATIGWSAGATALRRRLALLRRELGEPWPDVSEPALLAGLDHWLAPELEALAEGRGVASIDLEEPLRRLLPWPEAAGLDSLVPERIEVPSGSRIRVDYPDVSDHSDGNDDARPVVAVKLQECFGWDSTPRLVNGRVPVLFHLLSPAGRPLAVTGDLASFWSGPYAQVRAEMRGRYPKHPWPEDPWTATATAKTKNRM